MIVCFVFYDLYVKRNRMENVECNGSSLLRKSIRRSLSSRRTSLRSSLGGDTDDSLGSVDREWMRIQQSMQEVNALNEELQNEFVYAFADHDDDCVRAITFDSPDRKPLDMDELDHQREEVYLLKRSLEIDEDNAAIADYIAAMQENFALMFAEVTLRRLNARKRLKTELDIQKFVASLNLGQYPPVQWANVLEHSICQAVVK